MSRPVNSIPKVNPRGRITGSAARTAGRIVLSKTLRRAASNGVESPELTPSRMRNAPPVCAEIVEKSSTASRPDEYVVAQGDAIDRGLG